MGDSPTWLLDGEKVLWSGQPRQGLLLTPRDWLLIPFSLMWGSFAVFWEASVLQRNAPAFFALWGVPFVLIGLYLIVGRFVLDAWVRSSMSYAVTDRRVLIYRSGPFAKFIAVSLDRLPNANLVEGVNGRGTIRFGEQVSIWTQNGAMSWTPSLDPTPQFLAIADAQRVSNLVQRLPRGEALSIR